MSLPPDFQQEPNSILDKENPQKLYPNLREEINRNHELLKEARQFFSQDRIFFQLFLNSIKNEEIRYQMRDNEERLFRLLGVTPPPPLDLSDSTIPNNQSSNESHDTQSLSSQPKTNDQKNQTTININQNDLLQFYESPENNVSITFGTTPKESNKAMNYHTNNHIETPSLISSNLHDADEDMSSDGDLFTNSNFGFTGHRDASDNSSSKNGLYPQAESLKEPQTNTNSQNKNRVEFGSLFQSEPASISQSEPSSISQSESLSISQSLSASISQTTPAPSSREPENLIPDQIPDNLTEEQAVQYLKDPDHQLAFLQMHENRNWVSCSALLKMFIICEFDVKNFTELMKNL